MSDSNWLRRVAVRGFLVIITTLALAEYALSTERHNSDQDKPYYTHRNERKTAQYFALFTLNREKPYDTNWAKPNCKQPQNHDEADLCQQIEMTHIANYTFRAGVAQAILTGLTVAGLVITVIYTIKAANAAAASAANGQTAAAAATNAAQAAQRSAELAESAARNIERPYIFLRPTSLKSLESSFFTSTEVEGESERAMFEFDYVLQNAGRLPAIVRRLHFDALIVIKGVPVGDQFHQTSPYHFDSGHPIYEIIPANTEYSRTQPLLFDPSFSIEPFGDMPVIFGFVEYSNPANRRYQRGFCFIYVAENFHAYGGPEYNYDREIEDLETR